MKNIQITGAVGFSVELANCIHYLQLERDQSVLYLSNIGPETKYFLFQRFVWTILGWCIHVVDVFHKAERFKGIDPLSACFMKDKYVCEYSNEAYLLLVYQMM